MSLAILLIAMGHHFGINDGGVICEARDNRSTRWRSGLQIVIGSLVSKRNLILASLNTFQLYQSVYLNT